MEGFGAYHLTQLRSKRQQEEVFLQVCKTLNPNPSS